MKYWQSRGFHGVAVASPTVTAESFHPIYGFSTQEATQTYERWSDTAADIVLMLGTGMPTLGAHLFGIRRSLMRAVSCNLALAWLSVCATNGEKADLGSLTFWLSATEWESRFGMLHSSPPRQTCERRCSAIATSRELPLPRQTRTLLRISATNCPCEDRRF